MHRRMASPRVRLIRLGFVLLAGVAGGCAVRFSQRSPWDIQRIQALSNQLEQFKTLAQLKAYEADRLRQGKALLDERLSSEIASDQIKVGFDERGLVVRLLDRVVFDSGKAEVRPEAHAVLDKVARVLNDELVKQPVSVEGHTDTMPITHSRWKDNWELSLAWARSVLTYLVKQRSVAPMRIAAAGYGEYRPIASNGTAEGRQENRRVEIVVLPVRAQSSASAASSEASGEAHTSSAYRK